MLMAQRKYLGRFIFCIIFITRVIIFMVIINVLIQKQVIILYYHRHNAIQVAYLAASNAVKHKNKTSLQ